MTAQFPAFANAVHQQYRALAANELFTVDVDKDELWAHYLASFPPGTDPIFRINTEHTCSCCRNFVKNLGAVVAIKGDKIATVWDDWLLLPAPYNTVARKMAEKISAAKITGVFRSKEGSYGAEQTAERDDDGTTRWWNHFHGPVLPRHFHRSPGEIIGQRNAAAQVFGRGLQELKLDDMSLVLELIDSKGLYRGEEHRNAVAKFVDLKIRYDMLPDAQSKQLFIWNNHMEPFALIRNTVIGTLLVDLSIGMPVEDAVKAFEQKVAPLNYKRPTALVTPKMIDQAIKTLHDAGLEDSLQRRYAKLSDISVNNVLWVSNASRGKMKGGLSALSDELKLAALRSQPEPKTTIEAHIEDFAKEVLPLAKSIELLVSNDHLNNFMSLTTAVHEDSPLLFKWPNRFAWSYSNDVTDSIRERVKAAGGKINTKLRVSLAWSNRDDLDLHMHTASQRIYFANKRIAIGELDVDMNAGGPHSRTPVENIALHSTPDGRYRIVVNQYNRRENTDVGFAVEIEHEGKVIRLKYEKPVQQSAAIDVGTIIFTKGEMSFIKGPEMIDGDVSREHWGIRTQQYVPVSTMMLSPNYWDEPGTGNKHWLFLLEGCKSTESARGIYNEFLMSSIERDHRKVFELLGNKTRCAPSDEQLSGVGFSSTRSDKVVARVRGDKLNQLYTINF